MPNSNASREGILKFECCWQPAPPPEHPLVWELCHWRNVLYRAGLIGATPEGIGYGNVSVRSPDGFFITGTGTGAIPELTPAGCTEVLSADIAANRVVCRGPVRASSETLTHAALYACAAEVGAVVHVHHRKLWETLLQKLPTTPVEAEYGTVALARAVAELYPDCLRRGQRVLLLGGHPEGLLSFGSTLEEAATAVLQLLEG
ncbi:MAG: class II aldolase/adducin family protein [Chlorobiota bacterium]|jgi:hypothetical protein|nr:class II aldolase/adducin family protein [Chlorobiota bacterium]